MPSRLFVQTYVLLLHASKQANPSAMLPEPTFIRRPPTQKVYEGSVAALKRLQLDQQLSQDEVALRQQVLLVAQPDLSFCGR